MRFFAYLIKIIYLSIVKPKFLIQNIVCFIYFYLSKYSIYGNSLRTCSLLYFLRNRYFAEF